VVQPSTLLAAKRRKNAAHDTKPWEEWETDEPQRGERLVSTHAPSFFDNFGFPRRPAGSQGAYRL